MSTTPTSRWELEKAAQVVRYASDKELDTLLDEHKPEVMGWGCC